MSDVVLTLHFWVVSIIQFRQHDFGDLNCFTIPSRPMKRCVCQLKPKVGMRVELYDLYTIRTSLIYEPVNDRVPFAHQ